MLQAHSRAAHAIEPEHRVGKEVFLVGHPIHLRVDVGLDSPEVYRSSATQWRHLDRWFEDHGSPKIDLICFNMLS